MEAILRDSFEWLNDNLPGWHNGLIGVVATVALATAWKGFRAVVGRFRREDSPACVAALDVLSDENRFAYDPQTSLLECLGLTVHFVSGHTPPRDVLWVRTGTVKLVEGQWTGPDLESLVSPRELRRIKRRALVVARLVIQHDQREANAAVAKLIAGANQQGGTSSGRMTFHKTLKGA